MSDEQLPSPPVPANVDLRQFPYMPLEIRRLLTSVTWIEAADHPRIGHALICLWCESWHQVPASSLPDNDRVLAKMAMCSAGVWASIRKRVLSAWIKCSDGLLYHPVVAEKALEAWASRSDRPDRVAERSEHARKAAKARWGHAQSMPEHAAAMSEHMRRSLEDDASSMQRAMPEQMLDDALNRREETGKREEKEQTPPGGTQASLAQAPGMPAPGILAPGIPAPRPQAPSSNAPPPLSPEADLYRRGKEVLGQKSGGMITRLLAAKGKNIALARAAIEQASTKAEPREYISAILRNKAGAERDAGLHDWLTGRDGFG
jgi:hypothetical protein